MGKKYIIELCEKPMENENGDDIWRVKGFNTLVFDQNGLNKLEEYNEPAGHKFEVGDVCKITNSDSYFIITKITPDFISYMWNDGSQGALRRTLFERQATFIRHSDEFYSIILKGFLNELD